MRIAVVSDEAFRIQKDNAIISFLEKGHEIFDIERIAGYKQDQFFWKADLIYVISSSPEQLPCCYPRAISIAKAKKIPVYSTIALPEAKMRSPKEI